MIKFFLFILNLYLIEIENCIYLLGDLCFRVLFDFMLGIVGLLIVVDDIINNSYFLWLFLFNIDKFINLDKIIRR